MKRTEHSPPLHRLGKQCLTGSRRPYKQRALRELRANARIFPRIMKEIYHFLQRFFRLILPGNILKSHSCLLLHIHLGIALADSHHAAAF